MKNDICICFLRGINVSGKNIIGMKDLTSLFINLDFSDVSTYLQSGNVIFRTAPGTNTIGIEGMIENALEKVTGMKIPVIVKSVKQINEIFTENPFLADKSIEPDKLHVTILKSVPGREKQEIFIAGYYDRERFEIRGSEIFLYCPDGYGRARLNNNFIERKLGVVSTTRNWKTITSLNEIANSLE